MPDFAKALRQLRPAQAQRHLFQPAPINVGRPTTSLSDQLEFLKRTASRREVEPRTLRYEVLPDGEEVSTPFGRHFTVKTVYSHDYFHGKVRLSRFSRPDLQRLMTLMSEKGAAPDRNSILFLDTETTGMQGGAGMCPFLVGVGYFVDDEFHMLQYFVRDFDEEPSMLWALGKFLEPFRLLVTYNGAAFDIPMLETRFTLSRLDSPFSDKSHLDLLTSARRLWRNGHGSCRLVALEKEILSFPRGPDVPGSMIPRAYFEYLQHRSSAQLKGVFTHNVYDVVSLAALTISACDRISAEPAALDEPLDIYSLARILENTTEWKRSIPLYEMALTGTLPEATRLYAAERLAVICRRAGEHERAVTICNGIIARHSFSLTAYEGAAIHYERVAADPARALEIVEHGLARLNGDAEGTRKKWKASLQARRERLRQKVIQF
jgi:uncharacterized protein YprB with RNaseH-like and TPR domain